MVRTNQGGSILSFILIGSAMAILLVGGAYFVRHNLPAIAGSDPVSTEESDSDPVAVEPESNSGDETNQTPQEETAQPAEENPTFVPPDQTAPSQAESDPSRDDQPQTQDDSLGNLPETGPGDVLLAVLMIGGVVGTGIAYLRSRAVSV